MIVSHSKKVIYCRLPKSASTSVSAALEPFSDHFRSGLTARAFRKVGLKQFERRYFDFRSHSHLSMAAARSLLNEAFFDQALKFSVVRHPVDWVFSYYRHVLRENLPPQYQRVYKEVRVKRDFAYFLDWLSDQPTRPISTQLIDENGRYLVDSVVRCENLVGELSALLSSTGIDFRVARLNEGEYSKPEFNVRDVDKIISMYQDDMLAFGYNPDGTFHSPNLSVSDSTRLVAAELGLRGLVDYDCWSPYSDR